MGPPTSNMFHRLCLESPKGAKSPFWAHFGFEIDESGKRVDEKCALSIM